jgi:pimeloyl-ACP methyl ester carboxylesterase
MKTKTVLARIALLLLVVIIILPFGRSREWWTLNAESREKLDQNFIELPQGVTHYEIAGPDNGPVLLLVHGFSVPSYIWDRNFHALADSGFRVIRYDAFGRGFSDRPEARYDAEFYNRQINDLLSALKITTPVNIAGVSMGGAVATNFAADFPEKVNKVVLIDPANQASDISVLKYKWLGEYLNRVWFVPGLLDDQTSDFYKPSAMPADYQKNFMEQMNYRGFSTAVLSTIRNFIAVDPRPAFVKLGSSGKPVLLMWGKQDKTLAYDPKLPSILNADLVMVDSCGHLPQLEQPAIVNSSVTAFLKK